MWNYGSLPGDWTVEKIGEYASIITDYVANGSFASLAQNVEYKSTPDYAVLIRLTDYNNGFNGNFVYIDKHAYEFLTKSKLFGGEIIISNVGANVGTVFRCPYLDTHMSLAPNAIMLKTQGNDDFYYYWFLSRNGQHSLKSIVTGSAQPKFNKTNFRDLLVPVPPHTVQNKIAEYLSNIDKKIELNKQINENLYQQLFALYYYYCDSSDGGEVELGALCQFQEGYVNPAQTRPEYFDGDVKWLRAVDINESFIIETSRTLTQAGFQSAKKSAFLFSPNTIAISKSGTIGRLGIVADYMCGNRAVINIAPKDPLLLPYIYAFLKSHQKEFPDLAVGSVQKNLYVSLLEPLPVKIFAPDTLSEFCNAGNAILRTIGNNCRENIRLAQLRDTLLPRLMSGELDLSGMNL